VTDHAYRCVALARRLAIALWWYFEHGLIPNGAQLKPIGD
jgi:hypothetical protein